MKILFISKYRLNHVGGVEKHISKILPRIKARGYDITLVTEEDIRPLKIKYLGLLYIWFWLLKNIKLIYYSDIIHIHDVFIWFLPFKLIFPLKKVYITFHGWEGKYPIPIWNVLNKQIANKLSNGSISIGQFIGRYYKIKSNYVIYGGISKIRVQKLKLKNTMVFVGRLESDTGLVQFLKWLEKHGQNTKVEFVGDGSLRKDCEKFGKVYGFCDPTPFYKKAETVVPSGYLTYLEAKSYGCKIKTFYGNKLKKEYWDEILKLREFDTWDDIANVYLKLWKK